MERFVDNGDGTILDVITQLMWKKEAVGPMTWEEAVKSCSCYSDYKDWRLPTIRELFSIIDYERTYPPIDPLFDCTKGECWSSTELADNNEYAWHVYFFSGFIDIGRKHNNMYVRAVRNV